MKDVEMGDIFCTHFSRKTERKREIGMPRRIFKKGIKWILKKLSVECALDSIGSGQNIVVGSCQQGVP
jgi:hypothetical protein